MGNGGVPLLSYMTVKKNDSSSLEGDEDSSDESSDGSEEKFLWG